MDSTLEKTKQTQTSNTVVKTIVLGLGSCGIAAGAHEVLDVLQENLQNEKLTLPIKTTGCIGMCYREPIVELQLQDGNSVFYERVDKQKAQEIFEKHILNNEKIVDYAIDIEQEKRDGVLAKQKRIVMRNCGVINPESLEEYLSVGGYEALKKALKMKPEDIIEEVLASGLRGRGGGGFPTGLKWKFCRNNEADKKYVVCNADEGDPGAFMDRGVLESDPHSVIEGMMIAGLAIGANYGYIYARAEYPLAIKRLEMALKQARDKKLLGQNICDSGFSFELKVKEGAGAFVCGEETALLGSIQGKRGMPNKRPPFPAQSGLWGKPTLINNVETYANVSWIIKNGAAEYAKLGTEKSKGTKVFALAGEIKRGGLIEVPMGISLREIVYDVGGGTNSGRPLKAVQIGGPSGGCLPIELIDTVVDYDSVTKTGAIMGSGGLVVMDETTCMVDVAKFFLNFTQKESCGKCTFCRIGTKRMLEILTRISDGTSKESDLELIEELAEKINATSLCGLGQTAPNPVLTTLKYFREEYEAHIKDKKCPALKCKNLIKYDIKEDNCIGCTACIKACPVGAISGERKEVHKIDQTLCTKCGSCLEACKFQAIKVS
jgi:NADH-quinone oxidoreductase subunit F